jgi:hypothetical protein
MAMFLRTCPSSGDTPAALWKKINQLFSEQLGDGAHPPEPLDWKYNSLWKVLQILTECS